MDHSRRMTAAFFCGTHVLWVFVALLILLGPLRACAQSQQTTVTFDDLVSSAEQWAQENLDEDALRALQQGDQEKARKLLADVQKQFQGEYVISLATLRDAIRAIIPLLEQYEETLPYALWLKTRLDYLDVAEQLRLVVPAPKSGPGRLQPLPPNPSPQKEREIWITKLTERPYPERARPYLSQLKSIFSAEHVPPQLVWIAEVESSFDPRVRSPAGAAGLFQLMPATAKRYGLRTAWPWDQRVSPEPSARAAAQYLHYLRRHLGDWRLALAAYNAGERTVEHLLAGRKVRTYDAIANHLPAETQMYVPKVEATLLRREGVTLAQLR